MNSFLAAAVAAILVATALVAVPLVRSPRGGAPLAALLVALLLPATAALLYAFVNTYPWITRPVTAAAPVADTPEIAALRREAQATPGDAAGWSRLGDAYMAAERYADAGDAFMRAMQLTDEDRGDTTIRLSFAEATILADRDALTGEAGRVLDEVLEREPANPKALWYGGMAALARGDQALARKRWSGLLELSPPPQVRQILEEQLAQLDAPATSSGDGNGDDAVRIPVRISVKPELAARMGPGAALFLIARPAGGAGPPLAVVRREAFRLPLDVEISDADSMVPGRSLSGIKEVRLTARIANDGEALAAPGDLFGEASWRPGSGAGSPLPILIDQVVQ